MHVFPINHWGEKMRYQRNTHIEPEIFSFSFHKYEKFEYKIRVQIQRKCATCVSLAWFSCPTARAFCICICVWLWHCVMSVIIPRVNSLEKEQRTLYVGFQRKKKETPHSLGALNKICYQLVFKQFGGAYDPNIYLPNRDPHSLGKYSLRNIVWRGWTDFSGVVMEEFLPVNWKIRNKNFTFKY